MDTPKINKIKQFITATLELSTDGKWSIYIACEQFGQGGYEGWGRTRIGQFDTVEEAIAVLKDWYTEGHIQKLKDRVRELTNK